MASGDLAERTHIEGSDELFELGRVLNQLASELQNALGSLRKERDLMNRVLEGMQEGVLLLGKDGHVVFANAALRHLLRLRVDVAGKTQLELIRKVTLKRIIDEAKFSMEPVSAEFNISNDLGSRRLLVHASAFKGEPQGMLAVFVDVTDLRRLEALRRDFVANVSHELRTPIAAVRSAAETLRRTMEVQPELSDEFVGIIERNTERLHQLVEELLDFSHIESREFKLALEDVDLRDSISQTLLMFKEQADVKTVRFSTVIPEGAPLVRADRRRLEQVLSNLLDNAIKYGSENTFVQIEVEPLNEFVRVAVRDSGQGIEAKHFSRLFERFYRVDAGRSREIGGTGLGLSIVKHLVEAMQGWVSVESTPGKGSVFYFTLPIA
jgi:two-component system phosphate regulon sensor histidine kinase PhoR